MKNKLYTTEKLLTELIDMVKDKPVLSVGLVAARDQVADVQIECAKSTELLFNYYKYMYYKYLRTMSSASIDGVLCLRRILKPIGVQEKLENEVRQHLQTCQHCGCDLDSSPAYSYCRCPACRTPSPYKKNIWEEVD